MTNQPLPEGTPPTLEHCRTCDQRWLARRGFCPYCGSPDTDQIEISGLAEVQAVTTVHRAVQPSAIGPAPYCIALVRLREAPAVKIMALARTAPAIGESVRVTRHGVAGAPYLVTSDPSGARD